MKEMRIALEDNEHEVLLKLKQKLNIKSWHDFIIAASVSLSHEEIEK